MRLHLAVGLTALIALAVASICVGAEPIDPAGAMGIEFPKPDRIRYDGRSLIIDGKPVFIYSGAIHYFRCPRELWKDRLQKLKDAGLNCVETYLAWNVHEPQEPAGVDDFSKLRDMEQINDFIQTARDLGLYVIIRPGPYICAEWDRGGFPGWLMNQRPDGLRSGHYLRGNSPAMLAWDRHWFTAAARVVKPHLITNVPKGSTGVILWQLENEYDWSGADLSSATRADVLRALAHASVDNGIDVPLFTCETHDPAFRDDPFLRSHVFNTTNKYPGYDMQPLIDAVEKVARYQPETFRGVTELQGGWFSHVGGVLAEAQGHSAAQITQLTLTAIERGCTSINYYMFYGGSNFGYGAAQGLTQSYDYNAPLREWGGEQNRYVAVKAIGQMLKEHGEQLIHSDAVELTIDGDHPDVSVCLRRSADGSQFFFIRNARRYEPRSGSVKVRPKDGTQATLSYDLDAFGAKVLYVPAGTSDFSKGEWLPKAMEGAVAPRPAVVAAPVRVVSIASEEPTGGWRDIHATGVFDQRYLHYRAKFDLSATDLQSSLALFVHSEGGGDALPARVNGVEVPPTTDGCIPLDGVARERGNTVDVLFENPGCPNYGPVTEQAQGVTQLNLVPWAARPRPLEGWRMRALTDTTANGNVPEMLADFDDRDWPTVNLTEPAALTPVGKNAVYRMNLPLTKQRLGAGVVLSFKSIDDSATISVNGQQAGIADDWSRPWRFDVTRFLHEGDNSIAVMVHNNYGDGGLLKGCDVEPVGRAVAAVQVSPDTAVGPTIAADQHRRLLVHYTMEFNLPQASSTSPPAWKLHLEADANAFVTLNGHLLGRYWAIGPQRDIWLPECWLNFGADAKNVIELQARPTVDASVGKVIKLAEVQPYGQQAPGSPVRLSAEDSAETVVAKAAGVRPTSRQIAWQRDEISAFIHFGMNTFTDREWGDGTEDPKLFNPTQLDARQWVRAAKAAGISRMILTAKHHDGFCLWPSKYTEHCVRNSPWKNGKGDVVGEFVAACRAEGMHYGIYISPWDRHEKTYGDSQKYNEHFLDQLREVLTNYPGIDEVWFDGACGEGPNGKRQEYDWRAYWSLIRELAPNACISVRGPDVRWCGNEAGHTRKSEWSVMPMPGDDGTWETSDNSLSGYVRDIYGDDLGSRDVLMRSRVDRAVLTWYPSQVNTSIRPGWFYHSSEDKRVRTLQDLLNVYYGSVGGNGQFLLNIPPDRRGLFHENDVARLKELGDVLKSTFAKNLLAGAKLSAEMASGLSVGDVGTLLDENPDTFWTTSDHPTSVTVTAELAAPVQANCLMLQEHIASGQRVEAFEVEVFTDGTWRPAASGTVIGYKRLVRFADATVSKIRVQFKQFRIRPTLASIGLYQGQAIATPKIERDPNTLAKTKWTILGSDSQDDIEGNARNAIDDNPATFWHTRYRDQIDPMPHYIAIDLGETATIAGFTYLPRQDQWTGGIILKARFEVSDDATHWTMAADNVDFDNIVNSRQRQVVSLKHSLTARYVRLTALRTANDENFASAADVSVRVK